VENWDEAGIRFWNNSQGEIKWRIKGLGSYFFPKFSAMVKTAHSLPVHHAHLSSWQSRGNPLPTTLPTVPVENVNGHILGKFITFQRFVLIVMPN